MMLYLEWADGSSSERPAYDLPAALELAASMIRERHNIPLRSADISTDAPYMGATTVFELLEGSNWPTYARGNA